MKLITMENKSKKTLRGATKALEAIDMPDEPKYPWGLELTLNDASLKKLKIDVSNISAGDEVFFAAKAKITRVSLNEGVHLETNETNDNKEISLQIIQMGWGKPGLE